MKKKRSVDNDIFADGDRLFKFPKEAPIVYKGKTLGTISLNIILDESACETSDDGIHFTYAQLEFADLNLLSKQVECSIAYQDQRASLVPNLSAFAYMFRFLGPELLDLDYVRDPDEYTYNLISVWGPASLCMSGTQQKLMAWLSDEKTANRKIGKLRKALLEYAFGKGYGDRPYKIGRSEIEPLRAENRKWVKSLYSALLDILGLAKDAQKQKRDISIPDAIDHAYISYLDMNIAKLKTEEETKEIRRKLSDYEWTRSSYHRSVAKPLSDLILYDKHLNEEFAWGRWEPNKLAKELLAKILGASLSKITSVLYKSK